ncbi:MAG TPA: HEAT repeat domain-containing protein [Terracidiphilus sp.]
MGEHKNPDPIEEARRRINAEALHDPEKRELLQKHHAIAAPLLDELVELGYDVDTLDDLRHQGKPWRSAIPALLRWLPRINDPDVKENIVRCISVPWVGNKATAELISEFKRYAPIDPDHVEDLSNLSAAQFIKHLSNVKRCDPSTSLAWAIGNALSIVDVKGFEKQIMDLCRNREYGTARQMLVLGLGRFSSSEAEEVMVELLNDEDVKLHAIIALGKMKSKRALFELEKLLTDKRAAIRKEARKAITKIMRLKSDGGA